MTDPFRQAADAVGQAAGIEPPATPPAPAESGAAAPPAPERRGPGAPIKHGKYAGRKRKRSSSSKGSSAPKALPAGSSDVQGPPPPAMKPLDPRELEPAMRETLEQITQLSGTQPPTTLEVERGARCFAPLIDHYAPIVAEKGGPWTAPVIFAIGFAAPRVIAAMRGEPAAAEPPAAEPPARPAEVPGDAGFSEASAPSRFPVARSS